MATLTFSYKQPYEKYYVFFNFRRVVPQGVEILSTAVSATDAAGEDVTAEIIGNVLLTGNTKVYIMIQGGTPQNYKITCRIVCDNDEHYEEDATLPVVEK